MVRGQEFASGSFRRTVSDEKRRRSGWSGARTREFAAGDDLESARERLRDAEVEPERVDNTKVTRAPRSALKRSGDFREAARRLVERHHVRHLDDDFDAVAARRVGSEAREIRMLDNRRAPRPEGDDVQSAAKQEVAILAALLADGRETETPVEVLHRREVRHVKLHGGPRDVAARPPRLPADLDRRFTRHGARTQLGDADADPRDRELGERLLRD